MTIEREAFTMVYALHKFCHYLLGNKFIFYMDHMTLLYLVWKPQVLGIIVWWLYLFLEYNFFVVYKPKKFHSVVDALFQMPDLIEQKRILDQTMDTIIFLL
jgi:hypothetical protein